MMNKTNKLRLVAALATAAALALGGCGGGGGGGSSGIGVGTPVAGASLPDSAGSSVNAFLDFVLSLSPTDETSEPLIIKEGFVPPTDDFGDPRPLT